MTEKELNQLHWLKKEIAKLNEELHKLENKSEVRAQVITGMPFGTGIGDNTANSAIELAEVKALLALSIAKAEIERTKLERYINSIEDAEIRLIVRLRHINHLHWDEIGYEMNMDRTTVSKKYYRFLKLSHNSHDKAV
jgi:hypothetical protein